MTVSYEVLMFCLCIWWVYVLQFTCCVDPETSKRPTSGPFKISIASIKDCTNPSKPYMKKPPVVFLPTTHNSTLSGNITFLRDTKNMKIRLRGFILRNGKWEPSYLMNNLDCHGIVLHLLSATMNIKYDRKNCMYSKGPFKTSVVSVNDCRNPGRQYAKKPLITFNPLIQNIDGRNMLGGNITILKDTKDITINIKSYTWSVGKWRLSRGFNNIDCHSALLHISAIAFKVKYDKKSCVFFKGFYSFKNLDVNQLQHIWVSTMPYGRLMWRSEVFNKDGTFICKESYTINEPAHYG